MGVARGDPPSREHKATHNSSTIENKNLGNKKKAKMEVAGSMLASCTLVVRGGGMVGKEKKTLICPTIMCLMKLCDFRLFSKSAFRSVYVKSS